MRDGISREKVLAVILGLSLQCPLCLTGEDAVKTASGSQASITAQAKPQRAEGSKKADQKSVQVKGFNGSLTEFDPPPTKLCIHSKPVYVTVPKPESEDDTFSWVLDDAAGCVKDPADVANCTEAMIDLRITDKPGQFKLTGKCNTAPDTVPISVSKPWEETVEECKFQKDKHDGVDTRCGTYSKMQIRSEKWYYLGCHVEEDLPQKEWTATRMSIPGTSYADFDAKPWNYTKTGLRREVGADGTWGEDHIYFPEEYFTLRKLKNVAGEGVERCVQHMLIYGSDDVLLPEGTVEYTKHTIEVHVNTETGKEAFSTIRDLKEVKQP